MGLVIRGWRLVGLVVEMVCYGSGVKTGRFRGEMGGLVIRGWRLVV